MVRGRGGKVGLRQQLREWSLKRIRQVVAHAIEADDAGDALDAALASAPSDMDDHIDRFRDQRTGRVHRHFENQLLQAQQRAQCGAGVDGRDAAWMAGAPHLDEIQCLGATHLADDHATSSAWLVFSQ